MEYPESLPVTVLDRYPKVDEARVDADLAEALAGLGRKIVVLDDDPTGVQTVHHVPVYTDWRPQTLLEAFSEDCPMFFILTNSRAFTAAETGGVHRELANRIADAAAQTGRDFIVISRSDSTLRGHYPLETETLREGLEALTEKRFQGEIVIPFFLEGGRYTFDNIHYVREGDRLVPAGNTEFARDKSFGYSASHLGAWCEEKTHGRFPAGQMLFLSVEELRAMDYDAVAEKLLSTRGFNKIIVNAVDYVDVKLFAVALARAIRAGGEYLIRGAAAIAKVLGGVPDRPLLRGEELTDPANPNGGIVLIGSHVNRTTRQMERLRDCAAPLEWIEFNQHLILSPGGLAPEVERVVALCDSAVRAGKTAVVYTRRDRLDLGKDDPEGQLRISVEISSAVTSIIRKISARPRFLIAKGGITSSDVGVKALGVRRAEVIGQVAPGVPVWMTGPESKYPGLPYVIFPGNVGSDDTLLEIVSLLAD